MGRKNRNARRRLRYQRPTIRVIKVNYAKLQGTQKGICMQGRRNRMLERDVIAAIRRYLTSLGSDVFFFKEHGGPYGTAGVPDIICCYKGRFLGLEAKLPGGRLTELQKRLIERIHAAGGIACRVESVEDVKAVIRRADMERGLEHD